MVAVGLTLCVPPVDCSVYVLPLLPVIVTCVAFAAVTVRVDELPAVIAPGLAAMVTVGVVPVELFLKLTPHPANSRDQQRQKISSTAGRRTADTSATVNEGWRESQVSTISLPQSGHRP